MKLYQALCNAGFEKEVKTLSTTTRRKTTPGLGRYVAIYDNTTEEKRSKMRNNEVTQAIGKFLTSIEHHNRYETNFVEDYITEFIRLHEN